MSVSLFPSLPVQPLSLSYLHVLVSRIFQNFPMYWSLAFSCYPTHQNKHRYNNFIRFFAISFVIDKKLLYTKTYNCFSMACLLYTTYATTPAAVAMAVFLGVNLLSTPILAVRTWRPKFRPKVLVPDYVRPFGPFVEPIYMTQRYFAWKRLIAQRGGERRGCEERREKEVGEGRREDR